MTHWDNVIVMGVSGTGKSTVAADLAVATGRVYLEGDELHPASNRELMRSGTPLTDADRAPWLDVIADRMNHETDRGRSTLVTCAALRRAYRDALRQARGRCFLVHLTADPNELAMRMESREGHFMPASLLASQLATLEELDVDEDGITISTHQPPAAVLAHILAALERRSA